MSTSVNGVSDALGTGPSAEYTLIYVITVLCAFTVFICMSSLHTVAFVRDIHVHIYAVTNLLMLYFWIKLTMKMPKFLTFIPIHLSPLSSNFQLNLPIFPFC